MNLVGKIFVVVIFVMSLVFMTDGHGGLRHAQELAGRGSESTDGAWPTSCRSHEAEKKDLTDQLDKLKQDVAAEKNAQRQAVAKVENERDVAEAEPARSSRPRWPSWRRPSATPWPP